MGDDGSGAGWPLLFLNFLFDEDDDDERSPYPPFIPFMLPLLMGRFLLLLLLFGVLEDVVVVWEDEERRDIVDVCCMLYWKNCWDVGGFCMFWFDLPICFCVCCLGATCWVPEVARIPEKSGGQFDESDKLFRGNHQL